MDNLTRFNRYVHALQQYIKREGHGLVPANHVELLDAETINLGAWVGYMRQRKKNQQLPQDRIDILSAVPEWNWGPLKPGPATKNNRNNEIAQLRRNGLSLAQIADQFQLSRQRVHQIVKRVAV